MRRTPERIFRIGTALALAVNATFVAAPAAAGSPAGAPHFQVVRVAQQDQGLYNPTGAGNIAVGDFNEDGWDDIVVCGAMSRKNSVYEPINSEVRVYLNAHDGTFFQTPIVVTTDGYWAGSVTVGDFNHDGHADIAVTGNSNGIISATLTTVTVDTRIFLGDGLGHFRDGGYVVPRNNGWRNGKIFAADFNHDGYSDLIMSGATAMQPYTVAGLLNGNGSWNTFYANPSMTDWVGAIAVGDANNDQILDLASIGYSQTEGAFVHYASGLGTNLSQTGFYDTPRVDPAGEGVQLGDVIFADLDGTGQPAIVVEGATALPNTSGPPPTLRVDEYAPNGNDSWRQIHVAAPGAGLSEGGLGADSFFGTARKDVVASGWTTLLTNNGQPLNAALTIYQNLGSGVFSPDVIAPAGSGLASGGLVVDDFDHDGKPDIVASGVMSAVTTPGGGPLNAQIYAWMTNAHPPVAVDDNAGVFENTPLTIDVLANDVDPNGYPLHMISGSLTAPQHGTAQIVTDSNGRDRVVYTPTAGYTGTDSFTYRCTDDRMDSGTATVSINVVQQNVPQAVNDSYDIFPDSPRDLDVLANDVAAGHPIAVNTIGPAAHGTVTKNADGTLHYAPSAGARGADSFTYNLIDTVTGAVSNTATVSLNITYTSLIARDDSVTAAAEVLTKVDVLANDSDPYGFRLAIANVTVAAHGQTGIDPDGVHIDYRSNPGFIGTDQFTYRDGDGVATSNWATVTVTVKDVPVANNDSAVTTNQKAVVINVLKNDTDPGGKPLTVDPAALTQPAHGGVMLNPDQTITYIPLTSFVGTDTFTYRATNGTNDSNVATVSVEVDAGDPPPVAYDDYAHTTINIAVDIPILTNDLHLQNRTLSVKSGSLTAPAHGSVILLPDNRVHYTPAPNFQGRDQFTYQATDGVNDSNIAHVVVDVDAINHPPVAVGDTAQTPAGTMAVIDVLANDSDPDGDSFHVNAILQRPAHGSVGFQYGTNKLQYFPDSGFVGQDTFTYNDVDDGGLTSNEVAVTVTVYNGGNQPPVANDGSVSIIAGNATAVYLSATDDGLPNPPNRLTYQIVTWPSHGKLGLITDNKVTYTPAAGFAGADSFTFEATDGQLYSNVATMHLAVRPPSFPVANPDKAGTRNDMGVRIMVLRNDTGDGTLSVHAITQAAVHGTATIDTDQKSIIYAPAPGFVGIDTFDYDIADGYGQVSQQPALVRVVVSGNGRLPPFPGGGRMTVSGGRMFPLPFTVGPDQKDATYVLQINGASVWTGSPDGETLNLGYAPPASGTYSVALVPVVADNQDQTPLPPLIASPDTWARVDIAELGKPGSGHAGVVPAPPPAMTAPAVILDRDGLAGYAGDIGIEPIPAGDAGHHTTAPAGLAPDTNNLYSLNIPQGESLALRLPLPSAGGTALASADAAATGGTPVVCRLINSAWTPIPSDSAGGYATAMATESGTYGLFFHATSADLPADLRFGQVYAFPNPARPGQTLRLHVEAGAPDEVRVNVYDETGRLAAQLRDAGAPALVDGAWSTELTIDTAGLASGVYTAVVTAKKAGAPNIVRRVRFAVIK